MHMRILCWDWSLAVADFLAALAFVTSHLRAPDPQFFFQTAHRVDHHVRGRAVSVEQRPMRIVQRFLAIIA